MGVLTTYPSDWVPGQAYDRSHLEDCIRCGCTANGHDRGWRCPETLRFKWNRLRRWLASTHHPRHGDRQR